MVSCPICNQEECEWYNSDNRCICGAHGCFWGNEACEAYMFCRRCESLRANVPFCPAKCCDLCQDCCPFNDRCKSCGNHCEGMIDDELELCCDCN